MLLCSEFYGGGDIDNEMDNSFDKENVEVRIFRFRKKGSGGTYKCKGGGDKEKSFLFLSFRHSHPCIQNPKRERERWWRKEKDLLFSDKQVV